MKQRIGQIAISVSVLLSVIGGVAAGVFVGLSYVNSAINTAVAPVQEQEQQNQTAIAALQVNVEWIRSALSAKGFAPSGAGIGNITSTASSYYYGQ